MKNFIFFTFLFLISVTAAEAATSYPALQGRLYSGQYYSTANDYCVANGIISDTYWQRLPWYASGAYCYNSYSQGQGSIPAPVPYCGVNSTLSGSTCSCSSNTVVAPDGQSCEIPPSPTCTAPQVLDTATNTCVDPCASSSPLVKTFFVSPTDITNITPGFLIAPATIIEACGTMVKISSTDCVLNATQTKCTATYGVSGETAPDPVAPENYCYPPDTLTGSVCVPPAPTSATCPAGQVAVGTGTGSYCVTADDPCLIYGNCSQPVDGTGAGTPGTGSGTGGGSGTGAGSPGGVAGSGTGATGGTTAASAIDWTDVPSTLGHVPGAVSIPTSTPTFQFTTVAFTTVAGCPAPVSFNVTLPQVGFNRQFEISYQPLCDVATWLRPIFLALAAVAAAMIFAAGLTI